MVKLVDMDWPETPIIKKIKKCCAAKPKKKYLSPVPLKKFKTDFPMSPSLHPGTKRKMTEAERKDRPTEKVKKMKTGRFSCRSAVFTVSKKANPDWDPEENREEWEESEDVRYICGQWEKKDDYIHFQGYVQFLCKIGSRKKIQVLLKFKGWCDNARGNLRENQNYTSKEDLDGKGNRMENTEVFTCGSPVDCDGNGKGSERSDLNHIHKMIKNGKSMFDVANEKFGTWSKNYRSLQLFKDMTDKRKCPHWRKVICKCYYGDAGAGKSKQALMEALKEIGDTPYYRPVYRQGGSLWFNNYENEKILILDEFYGQLSWSYFLQILDGFKMEVEKKGGSVWSMWEKIYITANVHPSEWYPNVPEQSKVGLARRFDELIHFTTSKTPQQWRKAKHIHNGVLQTQKPLVQDETHLKKKETATEYFARINKLMGRKYMEKKE